MMQVSPIKFLWLTAFLLGAYCSVVHAEEPQLSDKANNFLHNGVEYTLAGCNLAFPLRGCRHGKLLHAGPKKRFVDNNSGEKLSYQEFEYEGMKLVIRAGNIVSLAVKSSSWPKYLSLGVGTSRMKILKTLGKPNPQNEDPRLIEYCSYEVDDCVSFVFDESGTATEVMWSFYYD